MEKKKEKTHILLLLVTQQYIQSSLLNVKMTGRKA